MVIIINITVIMLIINIINEYDLVEYGNVWESSISASLEFKRGRHRGIYQLC